MCLVHGWNFISIRCQKNKSLTAVRNSFSFLFRFSQFPLIYVNISLQGVYIVYIIESFGRNEDEILYVSCYLLCYSNVIMWIRFILIFLWDTKYGYLKIVKMLNDGWLGLLGIICKIFFVMFWSYVNFSFLIFLKCFCRSIFMDTWLNL